MQRSDKILLDLNNPLFQEDLFSLEKEDLLGLLRTLRKIRKSSWTEVYKDKGLRWELIQSRTGPDGQHHYTLHVTQAFRALVYREGQFMRFLSLPPDLDSAYK